MHVLLLLIALMPAWGQPLTGSGQEAGTASDDCVRTNSAFQPGEEVVYKVIYNWNGIWLHAGQVFFSVTEGVFGNRQVYKLRGYGATYKSYDWFYKVRDLYESYIDRETLLPLKFIRDVYEGGYTIYENVTFDHDANIAESTKGIRPIDKCTQDVLSAIYFARNVDFSKYQINDTIPFNIFIDDSLFNVYIRYIGKETIKCRKGTFDCIKFRAMLVSGTIFKGGERMTVWVTDDDNRLPVVIESPIVVGSIRAELHSWKGLRHPMRSKIS